MANHPPDLALGVGARSEKGRRDENQDKMTAFATSIGTVYIVADGMGGHRGGAEASQLVIDGYRKHLTSFDDSAGLPDILQAATTLTNAEIMAAGHSGDPSMAGMGSTVVMAVLQPGSNGMQMVTAHVGDSRAYLLRAGSLRQLTHDHSAVQRMVDAQVLTREQARAHVDANVLTRALGQQPDVAIEINQRELLQAGDTVLLCSDGLWGYIADEQIEHELSLDRTASHAADTLVELALESGSDDNITVQVLRLDDPGKALQYAPVAVFEEPLLSPPRETLVAELIAGEPFQRESVSIEEAASASSPAMRRRSVLYPLVVLLVLAIGAAAFYLIQRHRRPHPAPLHAAPRTAENQPCPHRSKDGACIAAVAARPADPPPTPAGVTTTKNSNKDRAVTHPTNEALRRNISEKARQLKRAAEATGVPVVTDH